MFNVVLHEPEIPPNTGNLMRLCVNTGCELHLVHPLGFELDDARMRRAGLDYQEHARVHHHDSINDMLDGRQETRVFAFSQHGSTVYTDIAFQPGDVLLFGKESVGLPERVVKAEYVTEVVRIPIAPGGRSLNLANAAAIAVYEAWRQNGFA
ncbi:MAG: tRNA (cytidine(34)-2'-O)-methyltransferase [Acidimicrobiia bacterium]|nr:tRNA (cytidine(34)-2'-O)-methyltransferase [Acidimicrobiia bacterium]